MGNLVVKPDAAYLVEGFNNKKYETPEGLNADLWYEIGNLIRAREHPVTVTKVDAHLEMDVIVAGQVTMQDFHGNTMADALASLGAGFSAVPFAVAQQFLDYDKRTWAVLQRLVAVNMYFATTCPRRSGAHRPKRQKEAKTYIQRAIEGSGHDFNGLRIPRRIRMLPTRLTCQCCAQSASRKTIKAWLKRGNCDGPMLQSTTHGADIARPPPQTVVRVGRADLHISHLLRHRRGLWWCSACGFYTTAGGGSGRSSAKNLKKLCNGRAIRGTAGHDYLTRIHQGRMPKKGLAWPSPVHVTQWAFDPFEAVPRCRLNAKTTLSLGQLEAFDLPDPQDEEEDCLEQEESEEQDPFFLGPIDFDQP